MKWSPDDNQLKFIALCIAGYFVCFYVSGMFALKQATNPDNKELRMAIVVMVSNMITYALSSSNNKKDKL